MDEGGTAGERPALILARRRFLTGAAATALVALSGCGDDDGTGGGASSTNPLGGSTTTLAPGSSTTVHTGRLNADPFTLGVASGDPMPDSVILWTRLAPDPLADDGAGGMPDGPFDVRWEMAADAEFGTFVSRGVVTAKPDEGHALHVAAQGLEPATEFWYRFRVGEYTSPPGRTRTLPEPGTAPAGFSLAIANCQWLEFGRYAAYRHMAEEELDLVLHLGDYIYEYPGSNLERTGLPKRAVTTLADYRLRYASYKVDAELQAAHASAPFMCTWDDHEVANNYQGDVIPEGESTDATRDRKAAAYRAWWENLPVRLDPPDGSDLTVYRDVAVGNLARIYLMDQRQDADVAPCRDVVANDYGDCDARAGEDRSILGSAQEQWFAERSDEGGVTWDIVGNPVVLAGIDAGVDDTSAYYLDTWDGYPLARQRLIEQLATLDNPVVLTGDYHAGMVFDVHATPYDNSTEVVAPEFMAPPISSLLFDADVSARTPQLRQQLNAHGYLSVSVEPEQLTARFRTLDDVTAVDSPINDVATWVVDAGNRRARQT